MIDELVIEDLVNTRSLCRVIVQDFSYQISCRVRNGHILRERIGIHTNSLVSGLNITCFKGWLTDDQGIDDDTERPHVYFVGMTLLSF